MLVTAAVRCIGTADPAGAQALATEALALAEEAGDISAAARARCVIGNALGFSRPAAGRDRDAERPPMTFGPFWPVEPSVRAPLPAGQVSDTTAPVELAVPRLIVTARPTST